MLPLLVGSILRHVALIETTIGQLFVDTRLAAVPRTALVSSRDDYQQATGNPDGAHRG